MSSYLIINIATIIFPLLYSFESSIGYYKKLKSVLYSSLVVGIPFIIWDIFATARSDWAFNPEHLIGLNIFNIPLEEILFFVTVPYSMIFLYEIAKHYLKDCKIKIKPVIFLSLSLLFVIFGAFNQNKDYTFSVSIAMGVFFFILYILPVNLKVSSLFWVYMIFAFIPFLLVNYILTSLPIVTYNSNAIFNLRITTIPIEDFFYNFALVGSYIVFYEYFSNRLKHKEEKPK